MQKKREENGDSYDPICVVANLCYMLLVRHEMTILLLNSKKLECLKESQKKKIEVRYVLCFEAISDLGVNLSKSVMVLFGSVSDVSNLISPLRMPSYDLYDYL